MKRYNYVSAITVQVSWPTLCDICNAPAVCYSRRDVERAHGNAMRRAMYHARGLHDPARREREAAWMADMRAKYEAMTGKPVGADAHYIEGCACCPCHRLLSEDCRACDVVDCTAPPGPLRGHACRVCPLSVRHSRGAPHRGR